MKKLLVLIMAIGIVATSCNNNKDQKNPFGKDREKDDYGKRDDKEDNDKGGGDWSSKDRSKYMKECNDQMAKEGVDENLADQICSCSLEKVSMRYSSYAEADRGSAEKIADDIKACAEEVAGKMTNTNTNNNNSDGWTSSDERRFMNECENTASAKVGGTRAREYCNCMLGKLKRATSSYADAEGLSESELQTMMDDCNSDQ